MELKVWVEGIQRIVCGVTETTTCQDVVFALAHATGKVGRFTLIERWRSNERLLAPNENPLKILMKWGEYSSDVQFILQRSDQLKNDTKQQQPTQPNDAPPPPSSSSLKSTQPVVSVQQIDDDKSKENGAIDTKQQQQQQLFDNIGIVKGVPQTAISNHQHHLFTSPQHSPKNSISTDIGSCSGDSITSTTNIEFNSADVRNSLDRKTSLFREARNLSSESLLEAYNARVMGGDLYKNGPPISSNGALVPPPYRDPPPPRTSPLHQKSDSLSKSIKKYDYKVSNYFVIYISNEKNLFFCITFRMISMLMHLLI